MRFQYRSLQSPGQGRAALAGIGKGHALLTLTAAVRRLADQRAELEHLCRYITRPAIANERLERKRAGQVVLQLKIFTEKRCCRPDGSGSGWRPERSFVFIWRESGAGYRPRSWGGGCIGTRR